MWLHADSNTVPYRDKLPGYVNPLLPEGETYVAGFLAKVRPAHQLWMNPRIVVVSNRRVHVFLGGSFLAWRPKKLLVSLPDGEAITAQKSPLYYKVHLGDQKLVVARFHQDALEEAIDASHRLGLENPPVAA